MSNKVWIGLICVIVVIVAVIIVMNQGDDKDESEPEEGYSVSFFLYDSFENDPISGGLLPNNEHLADGFWVKGYGETKTDCLKDACARCGIDIVISDSGAITRIGNVTDGLYCVLGWADSQWSSEITLSSDETFKVRYMAVGHGRWTTGDRGTPPTPTQTPDDIIYYAGSEVNETGVGVFFYDNYVNDPDRSQNYPYPSDLNVWIADGIWAEVAAGDAENTIMSACKLVFGNNINVSFSQDGISRIGEVSGYLSIFVWDADSNNWVQSSLSDMDLNDGDYIAIGHGMSKDGVGPLPTQVPSDIKWTVKGIDEGVNQ